jgi:NAD(P)-dependent dehydrogenase (short-subunit alcohol dehydrogenase family)
LANYTESGQVIPVSYHGQAGSFVHQMFLSRLGAHAPVEKQISDIAAKKGISQKEATNELLAEKQPSLDFASPEQLGGTVAFLCSVAADQITGTAISVDGGWTAR